MGNIFRTKQICEAEEPMIDKTRERAQDVWNQMESDNVFQLSLGQTIAMVETQFPDYNFRIVSLDGYSLPTDKSYDMRRININVITVDGQQIVDSINSIG
jgi:hypothetical protein